MKNILLVLLMISIFELASSEPTVIVKLYTIDSSTSRNYTPLAIPRYQLAPLSGAGDLAIYMSAGFPTTSSDFYITFNLDSTTRWVEKWTGLSYPYDHAHISVYNDTIYWGKGKGDNTDAKTRALKMVGDSLTQLFQYDWQLPYDSLYINAVWRLPGSDTAFSITRGFGTSNTQNIQYSISTDRGQSWGARQFLANWGTVSTVRIGGLVYNNTIAVAACSSNYAIVWFTWNRATQNWMNEGHVFNRPFYRGYEGNCLEDTIRFIVTTKEYSGGDSVICAYRNKGEANWTEGPAFQSSTVTGTLPSNAAITYIESSRRLVLFYTKSDYALDDSIDVYMRYWKTAERIWSSPTKISRGFNCSAFVTACRVPVTHGDVCYVAYARDSVIGGTVYHYGDLAKISFQTSGDTIPPGRINDLGVQPGPAYGEATLSWTAPGDDAYNGTAGHYIIKYSNSLITEQNFNAAQSFGNPPVASPAGTAETCTIGNLTDGKTYYFAIKTVDTAGNVSSISNIAHAALPLGFSDNESLLPQQPKLIGNFPNPFNSSTRIEYDIASRSHVSVLIHDMLGRTVNTLVDSSIPAGSYATFWNGKDRDGHDLSSGIYFCRMRVNDFYESWKMVLLK